MWRLYRLAPLPMVRRFGVMECGARTLGTVRWTRYSVPCTCAALSSTCCLPLVTTALLAWLAGVRFSPGSTLGMGARFAMSTTRYTQECQLVEADI